MAGRRAGGRPLGAKDNSDFTRGIVVGVASVRWRRLVRCRKARFTNVCFFTFLTLRNCAPSGFSSTVRRRVRGLRPADQPAPNTKCPVFIPSQPFVVAFTAKKVTVTALDRGMTTEMFKCYLRTSSIRICSERKVVTLSVC